MGMVAAGITVSVDGHCGGPGDGLAADRAWPPSGCTVGPRRTVELRLARSAAGEDNEDEEWLEEVLGQRRRGDRARHWY
jgi:hypothetical protein